MKGLTWLLLIIFIVNSFADETLKITETPEEHTFIVEGSNHRARSLPEMEQNSINRNWSTLAEILDIYNTKNLAKNWVKERTTGVDPKCAKDITRYIEGLQKQEMWALKGIKFFFFFFNS